MQPYPGPWNGKVITLMSIEEGRTRGLPTSRIVISRPPVASPGLGQVSFAAPTSLQHCNIVSRYKTEASPDRHLNPTHAATFNSNG